MTRATKTEHDQRIEQISRLIINSKFRRPAMKMDMGFNSKIR